MISVTLIQIQHFQLPLSRRKSADRRFFFKGSCIKATILDKKEPPNKFLDGDVIVELKALSELQCWDYCLRHMQCKAYNCQYRSQDKLFKTCQLLSSESGLIKPKEDFTFYVIEQNDSDRKVR